MTSENIVIMWNERIPEHSIDICQAELWLALHRESTIQRGFQITFGKWSRDKVKMDRDYLLKYASKTMNNIKSREAQSQEFTR